MPFNLNSVREFLARRLQDGRLVRIWALAAASVLFLAVVFYFVSVAAPADFPAKTFLKIRVNTGLNEIAGELYDAKIIRSPFWFRIAVIILDGQRGVQAGDYFFPKPLNIFGIASRLTRGNFGLTPVSVTFPEGMTASQMASVLEDNLIAFDSKAFLAAAKPEEGYLFPDTYFFLPNATTTDIITTMKNNFDGKIKTIGAEIKAFKKSQKDIVVMASILEAEARTTETRKIISGILWKRLSLGMPLQVDAPFQYIIGKNTFQLTTADLKYDSPYNTYKYTGLPPTPIGNPGLDALTDAVTPTKSPYFYYLSDVRGNMHYAVTYGEHLINKEKYLR